MRHKGPVTTKEPIIFEGMMLPCKKCGTSDSIEVLSRQLARKIKCNDTGRVVCYGICHQCHGVFQIHRPTGRCVLMSQTVEKFPHTDTVSPKKGTEPKE